MEEETKVDETITTSAEETKETPVDSEEVQTLKQQLAEAEEAKRQLTARAKSAEAKLKEKAETPLTSGLSKEEAELIILSSQGYTQEQLEELKALARARGKGLIETQSDPVFARMKEVWEQQAKEEKSKLGASRGSSTVKKEKDFNSPGLTDEEHKAMWKEKRDQ